MAAESVRLRNDELRFIYLLIGECIELGADPLVWRNHFLTQLNRRLGSVASVMIEASFDNSIPGIGGRVDSAVSANQYTASESEILFRCVQRMPIEDNPFGAKVLGKAMTQGAAFAMSRKEAVDRSQWDCSRFVIDYFKPVGWYDALIAMVPGPQGFQCLNFARVHGDREFLRRDGQLLQLIVREMNGLSDLRLTSMRGESMLKLPPRERQVLLALAEGDDEKQTALRLGISRNTVHEYVRRLFSRYHVTSRAQLVMRAARQVYAWQLSDSQDLDQLWRYHRA